jgi:tRNA U34 5-methylaminomethyl-2-thiouridine-forming methyltransferase MnmC
MDNNFYARKLEGLKLIAKKMDEVEQIFTELCDLEDDQVDTKSFEEYHQLRIDLDELNDTVVGLISAVAPMVDASHPKPVTAAQVMAFYAASLR